MKYLFVLLVLCLTSSVIGQNRYHVDETNESELPEIVVLKATNKPVTGEVYYERENGQLKWENNYKDGKRDGLYRSWHENGQLRWEVNSKDGKGDGIYRSWRENGQLYFEGNYKDGKKDGLYREWYENGQLKGERNYKEGNLLSEKCWDEEANEIDCP